MTSIADALVYAVTYINSRDADDDDADVGTLESIAGALSSADGAELDALATAADAALKAELALASPRPEFVECLTNWMESMFGDEWTGNSRPEPHSCPDLAAETKWKASR